MDKRPVEVDGLLRPIKLDPQLALKLQRVTLGAFTWMHNLIDIL